MNPESISQLIPLANLKPSPFNARKHFDEARLKELAESIRAHGVLEPLLVRRKLVLKTAVFEIVAGERRYRAAKLAGLKEVPVRLIEATDQQAREIQVVENDQREDFSPLERARGYAQLLEDGATSSTVAQKIGRSPSAVRSALRLLDLPAKAREAVEAGTLPASTGELIARMPSAALREECAKEVLAGKDWPPDEKGQPLSFRRTKELIQTKFMLELKQAPFSQKAIDLVPPAGSCTDCPKRAGNNREAYPDCRADICLDPTCFEAKKKAHADRLVAAAKESGSTVLEGKEARGLFNTYDPTTLAYGAAYIDLAATCHDVPGNKGWEKLVGKELEEETVVAVDLEGGIHKLVPKDQAMKIVRKKHGIRGREPSAHGDEAKYRREQKEREQKARAGKKAALAANALVAEKLSEEAGGVVGIPPELLQLLRAVVGAMPELAWNEAARVVARRRKIEGTDPRKGLCDMVAKLNFRELLALIGELTAARITDGWGSLYPGEERTSHKEFLAAFGIDAAKLKQTSLAEMREGKPKKEKPSRNGHADPGPNGNLLPNEETLSEEEGWQDITPKAFKQSRKQTAGRSQK